ncbi:O-antigen ligase family protein [Spirochaeta cellobiosiphila]|uniref:O-antigen ligase family protein n=1 Tax=Spirochaeta cellobiosiphila TaxID=504483 RepID=UPI0004915E61|nr:O-antigen ligase family protein [Spirochaeta cellobiosiphila]
MNNKFMTLILFLSILLIGSDQYAFAVSGLSIRLVQFLWIIFTLLMFFSKKITISKKQFILFLLFLLAHVVSLSFSKDAKRSLGIIFWCFYNFLFITLPVMSYSRINPRKLNKILEIGFEIQGVMIIITFIIGLFGVEVPFLYTNFYMKIPRPALWFYEPTFLATFMLIYFAHSCYFYFQEFKSKYLYKALRSFFYVLFTTSLTGILGLFFTIGVIVFFSKSISRNKKVLYAIIIILFIAAIGFFIKFRYPALYTVLFGRLLENGFQGAGGGRVTGMHQTISIIKRNFWIGVGPGAYVTLYKYPPTNAILQLFVSVGVFGFFFSIIWFLYPIMVRSKYNKYKDLFYSYRFSYLVFFVILQANTNYMRLYHWMLIGIVLGLSTCHKSELSDENCD